MAYFPAMHFSWMALVVHGLLFASVSSMVVEKPAKNPHFSVTSATSSSQSQPLPVGRRSLLLSSASLLVAASAPSLARAEEPDEKGKAEMEAKRVIAEEVAREETKIKDKAIKVQRDEYNAKQKVQQKAQDLKATEARLKALQEARTTAEKLDTKLQETGDKSGASIERSFKGKEDKAKAKVKQLSREKKDAEAKLKVLQSKRLELEARYKLKTGKDLMLPPYVGKKRSSSSTSSSGVDFGGSMAATLLTGGGIALAAYSFGNRQDGYYNNNNNDNFFRNFNSNNSNRRRFDDNRRGNFRARESSSNIRNRDSRNIINRPRGDAGGYYDRRGRDGPYDY